MTTIEVDPVLAEQAAAVLAVTAPGVMVVCRDGTLGHADRAPYDHVIATCSLNGISQALLQQTKPGGTILTPWPRPWCDYGLLHLSVNDHGEAQGRFHPYAVFMRARGQRLDLWLFRDVVHDDHVPTESKTVPSPWAVAGDDYDAHFVLGLLLPDLWNVRHDNPDLDGVERRLWDEVTAARSWFDQHGRPSPGRFGMTVTADGTHQAWLDAPRERRRAHHGHDLTQRQRGGGCAIRCAPLSCPTSAVRQARPDEPGLRGPGLGVTGWSGGRCGAVRGR